MTSSLARKQNARKEDAHSRAVTSSPARKKIPREDRNMIELKQAQRPRSVWFSDKLQEICIQEGDKNGSEEGTVSHHLEWD